MEASVQDLLRLQSTMAVDFLTQSWPQVREQGSEILTKKASSIERIILCGCGDSHHAAVGLCFALEYWTSRRVRAATSMMAARYVIPAVKTHPTKTLVIGISASGEVARTLEAIDVAKAMGMSTLAITGSADSPLADLAESILVLEMPSLPHGPGLLSYLASLLMGYSLAFALSRPAGREEIDDVLGAFPAVLSSWRETQVNRGIVFAEQYPEAPIVFLGSGTAYSAALFAAAKVIEASGGAAWGQDVEEWAHLEYFCNPSYMPTWLLSARGRSTTRETEVEEAARRIGRHFALSAWDGSAEWSHTAREAVAPLGLWVGPVAYATRKAELLEERPFRDFSGGRSRQEGGGASRIRTSQRIAPEDVLGVS
jgi:glucosamine--fructose-6-phosphate aminotransferase (isomerizing)